MGGQSIINVFFIFLVDIWPTGKEPVTFSAE